MVGAVVGLGLTIGPPLGGFLLSSLGWPSIFLVNLPIGVFGLLYARATLAPDLPAGPRAAFDLPGAGLALAFLVTLTLFLSRGAAWGWSSPATLGCAVGAVAALAAFVLAERRAPDPLVDLAFFRDPAFRVPMLTLFASFIALFAAVFLVPFYLERVAGFTPDRVGRVLVVIPLLVLLVSPLSGALSARVGSRVLSFAGLATTSAGLLLLALLLGRAGERPLPTLAIMAGLFVIGLGQGLFQPPNSSSAMSAVPPARLGLAGGLLATMRNLGTLFGIRLAAAVYEGREHVYARTHSFALASTSGCATRSGRLRRRRAGRPAGRLAAPRRCSVTPARLTTSPIPVKTGSCAVSHTLPVSGYE
jgi:predicted MFS family arabinose efflux permease